MIIIKGGTLERIKDWQDESTYVLTDFDRTITEGNSESSWGILSTSKMVPQEYIEERKKLFDYYRPFEVDEKLDYQTKNKLMIEWWSKHVGLLIKYRLPEKVINESISNVNVMSFREGGKEFLKNMWSRNIPVIIISAGIGNFIEQFLIKNDCYFDNISIISNFIRFENGIAVGVYDNIIHSLNKNEVSLSEKLKSVLKNRKNIILLGDSISDIKMSRTELRTNALKIGFLEENIEENMSCYIDNFDIVCTNNTGYSELFDKLSILKEE